MFLPDQSFHHGHVELAVDTQLVGANVGSQLLVVSDHDEVVGGSADGRDEARLQDLGSFLNQHDPE